MDLTIIDQRIKRAFAGVRQAFRAVLGVANTNAGAQIVGGTALAGEPLTDVEMFQHYGFTSAPPAGTMAIVIPLGGRTAHGVVVATENTSCRVRGLANGEVAIYTDEGDSIIMHRGRVIDITTETLNIKATKEVNIDTPKVSMTHLLNVAEQITGQGGMAVSGGNGVEVDGNMTINNGDVEASGKSLVHHKHNGDSGGQTGEPL